MEYFAQLYCLQISKNACVRSVKGKADRFSMTLFANRRTTVHYSRDKPFGRLAIVFDSISLAHCLSSASTKRTIVYQWCLHSQSMWKPLHHFQIRYSSFREIKMYALIYFRCIATDWQPKPWNFFSIFFFLFVISFRITKRPLDMNDSHLFSVCVVYWFRNEAVFLFFFFFF